MSNKEYLSSKTLNNMLEFTNVSRSKKSRKIEHFGSNNNLKCKHIY